MSERTIYFTEFSEVCARSHFDTEAEISPDNFERLVGAYNFRQEVICQVRTPAGVCHQKHKKGCIGVMKDGREALIGNMCAGKYFKSDMKFALERKRINTEIERERILTRYQALMVQKDTLQMQLSSLNWEALRLNALMSDWYKSFQPGVLRFIYNAQKTANWNVVVETEHISVETVIVDGQEEAREISEWLPDMLGRLIAIPEQGHTQALVGDVKWAQDILTEVINCDPGRVSFLHLKRWVTVLDGLDEVRGKLDNVKKACEKFKKRENLELLFFVQGREDDQTKLLRQILRIRGNKDSAVDARREEKRIAALYSKRFEGRRWRSV
ncbi:hypothetical protein [Serratia entomophila]|uniref:hypothetical protein n=1 Tax=Serratia entomophila TaxID=42906 RepID=UPI002178D576|nr:hypothetical protein [Serratia entomophila]CAI1050537.1 Uncharacterised protein [Serratia entomophila]CAI1838222.1 Uncharacterised protein [Serratia entomophila]CAI2503247.1 Uncharacterised protein [Serratia entomophila]